MVTALFPSIVYHVNAGYHTTAACGSTGTSRLWFRGFGSIHARCHNWTWQVRFGPCLGPYYVTMLHGSMVRFLQALPHLGITAVILLDIMKCVLGLNGAWFLWGMSDASKRRCQRATHDSCNDLTQFSVFVACLLLPSLGLASCFQSVRSAGGGRPIWLLCKKPAWCLRGQATAASMLQESTWKSRVRVAKWHSQWYSQRQSLSEVQMTKYRLTWQRWKKLPLMAAYLELEVIQNTPSTASPHKDLPSAHPRRPPLGACQMAQILRRILPSSKWVSKATLVVVIPTSIRSYPLMPSSFRRMHFYDSKARMEKTLISLLRRAQWSSMWEWSSGTGATTTASVGRSVRHTILTQTRRPISSH